MTVSSSHLAGAATIRPGSEAVDEKEYVRSVERGLAALRCFTVENPSRTVSELAAETGLSRAVARRIVITLQQLGYVGTDGREYFLLPRVLELGYAYLSSSGFSEVARPHLEEMNRAIGEACSVGVLSDRDVIYVARAQSRRVMTMSLGIGARLDALPTAVGRVLLAGMPDDEIQRLLEAAPILAHTSLTVTDAGRLMELIREIREQGWAISDQELEIGIRTASAPILSEDGTVVAAVNVATHSSRISLAELADEVLPQVRATAVAIGDDLRRLS